MLKKRILIVFLSVVMLFSMSMAVFGEEGEADIVDTAIAAGSFETLVAAVQAADLVDALKGEGPFTVFAPTDEAFAALLNELDLEADELLASEDLASILLYHVVSGKVLSSDLVDGAEVETLNGEKVTISLDPVKINDSNVVSADIEASNGVIHVIDAVMLPAGEDSTEEEQHDEETPVSDKLDIVDTAVEAGVFETLVAAVQAANLVEALKGEGPFTVFAPTDDAFSALLQELGIDANELLASDDLESILLYHVVAGNVLSTDLEDGMEVETLNGEKVIFTVSDSVKVNDSNVIDADIEAANGVIHVIDAVLLPAGEQETPDIPKTGSNSITIYAILALGALFFLSVIRLVRYKNA
ncbi:fasciclin domain-containing protein [Evansella sp. AB-rgal1]|uniref:fasciclin domain-containing protein n=1 Tax=Evansella sp. AB-rgal1 TaxID=3242696 RepID=UPI00359DE098